MIRFFKYVTMIYIDYETNFVIIVKIKLNTTNIDKFNLKLIRISIYFSQFRIEIQHRFDKFNIISNALSRLSMKSSIKNRINNLNIDPKNTKVDQIYAYAIILMKMFSKFRKTIMNKYVQNLFEKKLYLCCNN